jgi:hypothetical protein
MTGGDHCVHCQQPITRCPDHGNVTYSCCGGWYHPATGHLCHPGHYASRYAEPIKAAP